MSVTVIYGSDGGTTRSVASRIAKRLEAKTVDIKSARPADLEGCSLLVLGVPTYGDGTLQADWEDNIETLRSARLANKKVAIFGLGDQETYPESFVDAMGILYDEVVELRDEETRVKERIQLETSRQIEQAKADTHVEAEADMRSRELAMAQKTNQFVADEMETVMRTELSLWAKRVTEAMDDLRNGQGQPGARSRRTLKPSNMDPADDL